MKKLLILIFLLLVAFWAGAQDRSSDCIIKASSSWGATCDRCEFYTEDLRRDHSGTFQIELKNTCTDIMEVKVAVQEENGNWRTFPVKALASGEMLKAFACNGSGKYMYWTRKAGDQEIALPTDRHIITQYH